MLLHQRPQSEVTVFTKEVTISILIESFPSIDTFYIQYHTIWLN